MVLRKKKMPNFKTKDLRRLTDRFRHHKQTQATGERKIESQRSGLIHIGILVILLAIATGLALYPTFKSQPPPPREIPRGSIGPYLGAQARIPQGCIEVRDARIPDFESYPPGSKPAVLMQKDLIRTENLPLEIENSIGMRFRLIPAMGTFLMGSPAREPGRGKDEDQHTILIRKEFYMGMYEVTQRQFEEIMGFNPSHFRSPDRPVENVTWYSAAKFCENLSRHEGLPEGIYVLPSEEEWEYACRANSQTSYYFGSDPDELEFFANYNATGTQPVGFGRPNAWGLYNMHGNVWEWCRNYHYDYKTRERTEFFQLNIGTYFKHSIRGGNFFVRAENCRSAVRHSLTGTSVGNLLGFRVLRRITPETLRNAAGPDSEDPAAVDLPVPVEAPEPRDPEAIAEPPRYIPPSAPQVDTPESVNDKHK